MNLQDEISDLKQKQAYSFEDLLAVTRILRSEQGCPWDREQDHHSIRSELIEETYEVIEAIDNEDAALLREELGDLLFQIVFHSQIEAECDRFTLQEVIHDVTAKMVHRHPHVFGNVNVENSAEVLSNWEIIKTEEKQRNTLVEKLRAIPPMLPALMRASKVGKKIGQAEGEDPIALLDKLQAQILLAKESLKEENTDPNRVVGALLMCTTDFSRALGVNAECALSKETDALIAHVAEKSLKKS